MQHLTVYCGVGISNDLSFLPFLRLHQYRNHRIHRCTNIKHTVLTPRENVSSQSVGQSGKRVSTLPVLSLRGKKKKVYHDLDVSERKSEGNL